MEARLLDLGLGNDFCDARVFGECECRFSLQRQTATRTGGPREGTCGMSGLEAASY